MNISIIGPCGAGKSTLARHLAKRWGLKYVDLDDMFINKEKSKLVGKNVYFGKKLCKQMIDSRLETINKGWVVEGMYPVRNVFDKADLIIFLEKPMISSLYGQWKRYFCDQSQREKYGFFNNMRLSLSIAKQYFSSDDGHQLKFRMVKVKKMMEIYKAKVIWVKNDSELQECYRMNLKNVITSSLSLI